MAEMDCDQSLDSSDAICQCGVRKSSNSGCMASSWPSLDRSSGGGPAVCSDCKVIVDRFQWWRTCSNYCKHIGRRCVGAWEEETEGQCDVKEILTCDSTYDSSDVLCECSEERIP